MKNIMTQLELDIKNSEHHSKFTGSLEDGCRAYPLLTSLWLLCRCIHRLHFRWEILKKFVDAVVFLAVYMCVYDTPFFRCCDCFAVASVLISEEKFWRKPHLCIIFVDTAIFPTVYMCVCMKEWMWKLNRYRSDVKVIELIRNYYTIKFCKTRWGSFW